MGQKVRLGPAREVPVNDFIVYQLDAIDVVVYRIGEAFYAISSYCPHAGINISRGPLQDGIITCPGHGLRFDVTTGACLDMPELSLTRFAVSVEDGWLYVTF